MDISDFDILQTICRILSFVENDDKNLSFSQFKRSVLNLIEERIGNLELLDSQNCIYLLQEKICLLFVDSEVSLVQAVQMLKVFLKKSNFEIGYVISNLSGAKIRRVYVSHDFGKRN